MLSGKERFYGTWLAKLEAVVAVGPVVDVGAAGAFHKEMRPLRGTTAQPYFWMDMAVRSPDQSFAADASFLPVRSGTVGAVLCSHVLQHIVRPSLVVDEVWRILRPGGRAYFTFLDTYPYHAGGEGYGDYFRFTQDAVALLLQRFADVDVLAGGGVGQTALNYLPVRLARAAQPIANMVDELRAFHLTPMRYAFATK